MKIKIINSVFGPGGILLEEGKSYDIESNAAARLVRQGAAAVVAEVSAAAPASGSSEMTADALIAKINALDLAAEIEALAGEYPESAFSKKEVKAIQEAVKARITEIENSRRL